MPLPPELAEVALAYDEDQAAISERAITLLARALDQGSSSEGYRDGIATIGEELLGLQVLSASLADAYVAQALEAQGADADREADVNPAGWADLTDGGGSWLRNLVFAPLSAAGAAVEQGASAELALARMQTVASSVVLTGLRDTARSSVQTGMQASRSAKHYVRMLRPPSCARCAILAGKRSSRVKAFPRHDHCDCVNVPVAEDSDDFTTNPVTYFKSLTREEQDRIFTIAGARAIREAGVRQVAMNQIVNARQGIRTVSAYGREIQITTEGTTVRGLYGGYEILDKPTANGGLLRRRSESDLAKVAGKRYRVAKAPRLLPDEIFRLADEFSWDRAEVLRQLRRFGYLL